MEQFLLRYGYFLLFLGVAAEGETFLLSGAFLAHRGYFRLGWVISVAVLANCAADQIYYLTARTRGQLWLESRFGHHPRYRQLTRLMAGHAAWLLLASRFAFGFRVILPAACGALGVPVAQFSLINVLAGTLWAVPTALLGFYSGETAERVLARMQHYEWTAIAGLVLAASLILLVRLLWKAEWVEDLRPADLHRLVPLLIGVMGVINLLSAIWPRSAAGFHSVSTWLPLEVTQHSRALMLLAGLALLQVTRSLARRKELAWYVAMAALGVSLLLHITRALDLHHSLVAGLLLAYLIYFRRRFNARSDPASIRRGLQMTIVLGLSVYVYGYVGLQHLHTQFTWFSGANPTSEAWRCGILIREPNLSPHTALAARFVESVQIAGWLARLWVLVLLLRPVILRSRMEAPPAAIARLFARHGHHSLAAFAIQEDKHHLLVASGEGLLAYAVRGSVALACGDPLVAGPCFKQAAEDFVQLCARNSWIPCFYEAAENQLSCYQRLGMQSLKIAEEAVLDLGEFSLSGNRRANLRAMVNKVLKTGMQVKRYDRGSAQDPEIDEQLEQISSEWLGAKRLGELGFTIGRFSLESLDKLPVFLAMLGTRIEAFCSWLPYRNGEAAVLDLMRKRSTAAAGTMDLLLAHSLLQLRAAGLVEASLANAPLANTEEPRRHLDQGIALLFERMNSFYGYKNLFQFKKKFAPRWEGRYLIYPRGADLPRVVYALTRLHTSGGFLQILAKG